MIQTSACMVRSQTCALKQRADSCGNAELIHIYYCRSHLGVGFSKKRKKNQVEPKFALHCFKSPVFPVSLPDFHSLSFSGKHVPLLPVRLGLSLSSSLSLLPHHNTSQPHACHSESTDNFTERLEHTHKHTLF